MLQENLGPKMLSGVRCMCFPSKLHNMTSDRYGIPEEEWHGMVWPERAAGWKTRNGRGCLRFLWSLTPPAAIDRWKSVAWPLSDDPALIHASFIRHPNGLVGFFFLASSRVAPFESQHGTGTPPPRFPRHSQRCTSLARATGIRDVIATHNRSTAKGGPSRRYPLRG